MFTIEQIETLHSKVRSGADFPNYIREIKEIGVNAFETWVIDSHTKYIGKSGFIISSKPKYNDLIISDISDRSKFIQYLKIHQQGESDYFTFCEHCAETGIEKWTVNLEHMTCIYFDKAGEEILIETVPSV